MNAMYSVLSSLAALPPALQDVQTEGAPLIPPLFQNPGMFMLVLNCRQTEIAYD